MEEYIVKKVLSNNVVWVENKNQNYILVGKGIGFGKKKDTLLKNPQNVDEKFISLKGLSKQETSDFLSEMDPKVIEIVEKIMNRIEKRIGKGLNEKIHVGFMDHVNFSIKRLREGIKIINPFLFETKLLYPIEYDLAKEAVEILKTYFNMNIPDAEIGFLALHIHGGRKGSSKQEALKVSKMFSTILKYMGKKLNVPIVKDSFDFERLIIHLRGVMDRSMRKQYVENTFLEKMKDELALEFKVAYDIVKIMEQSLKIKIHEGEIGYIAIHLHRYRVIHASKK